MPLAAVTGAERHPPESADDAATWFAAGIGDTGLPLAGPGTHHPGLVIVGA